MLINGRGQLGEALSLKIEERALELPLKIYHTWNFTDKSEGVQREEFDKFKAYIDGHQGELVAFISTYSTADTPYVQQKRRSEEYLYSNGTGVSIQLPNLVGKGVCQMFRGGGIEAFGSLELMGIEDAADEVLDICSRWSKWRKGEIIRVPGEKISAKLTCRLIEFGKDGK